MLEPLESRLAPATTFSIADSSVLEPAPRGTVNLNFTVTRAGDLASQVTVGYTTVAGTAKAGTDFTPTTGTVVFPTGAATETIAIPIFGNGIYNRSNLTFAVQLTGIVNVVGPPVTLASHRDVATQTNPCSVVRADINGDGKPDLIVANESSYSVSVLLNTTAAGAATPTFGAEADFTTGTSPFSVTAADVNGDGKPDLVVANRGDDTVSVLLNTTTADATTPTFATKVDFVTGVNPGSVTVADLNGDGKPDLAVADYGAASVSVLLNTTAAGAATPTFAPKADFATGTSPFSVVAADVNGDGRPDLIVANYSDGTVSVLLNTAAAGATTPTFAAKADFATGSGPIAVTVADVNGDGKPDLAVADYGAASVSVLLNIAAAGATAPAFAAKTDFATGTYPTAVTAADLNGDGKPDLIVANQTDNTVSVLLNTTTAGAATPVFAAKVDSPTGTNPASLAVGDLNGDGQPDIVVGNRGSDDVSVLLNTTVLGAATVVPSFPLASAPAVASNPFSVAAADLNGDGKPDLVVANETSGSVSVLLNTTAPGAITTAFAARADFATGSNPYFVAIADLNGDGRPDLVVANRADNTVSVLLNSTRTGALVPSFAAQQTLATGTAPDFVALADLNGDGKPDLAVANQQSNTVSVFLNATIAGASTASFALQAFATGTSPDSVAIADLNGDGKPDLVVSNRVDNTVSALLNTTLTGAATLAFAAQQAFATGTSPDSVAVADLNGDGESDLIATTGGSNSVSVLLSTTQPGGPPTFAAKTDFTTGLYPSSVAVIDLNGDGKPDLVVSNRNANTVSVLLNKTAPGAAMPSFAARVDVPTGSLPASVASADFNGDGRPDLVVANTSDMSVSVLLNTPDILTRATATGTITESDSNGFAYDAASQTLTVTVTADNDYFQFGQATTAAAGAPITYYFSHDFGNSAVSFTDSQVAHVVVNAIGTHDNALLYTQLYYTDGSGPHEVPIPELLQLGNGVNVLSKLDAGNTAHPLLTFNNGFTNYFTYMNSASSAQLYDAAGLSNYFFSYGNFSYLVGAAYLDFVYGAGAVTAHAQAGSQDATDQFDGFSASGDPSTFTLGFTAGVPFSIMQGSENGRAFKNEADGFITNVGIAQYHPARDMAYISDSPNNDVLTANPSYVTMYALDARFAVLYFDAVADFLTINAYSYVSGLDSATNNDSTHVHVTGFGVQH